ncbi:glycoside hydrolase family 11 protein, partial [Apiospora rasikravindrae]
SSPSLIMVSFTALALAATAITGALSPPLELIKKAGTPSSTGTHNGFYYSFWTDGGGNVNYQNTAAGSYNVNWQNCNNFVGGKGWNPGSARTISYNSTWNNFGVNSYLAVYGWTRNPLVEYYVVEAYGSYNPASGAQKKGTVTDDGGTYDIYQTTRVNQPSIEGTSTFPQFWSVRTQKRTSGTVNVKKHFDAWTSSGLRLGSHDYQILATEGYQSSGSASVTVQQS